MQIADDIPPFELPDQTGRPRSFADLKGPQGLVLFVYAKDHTSG